MQIRNKQIDILNDTLRICSAGCYEYGGMRVDLKLSAAEMMKVKVFLPDQIDAVVKETDFSALQTETECIITCENIDSFTMALKRKDNPTYSTDKEVLVLNFANSVNPGGGVRRGARAQEEDLCRTSTLLLSLESDEAKPYYLYNRALQTVLASDAVIFTPSVEVIKNRKGELLGHPFTVSVMTCAAPMFTYDLEGLSLQEYEDLFYNRIVTMLKLAACQGYKSLVLGAFGCGAFDNDAALVSDLFLRALQELGIYGDKQRKIFHSVDFAVLDRSEDQYNYDHFARNFYGE